MVNYATVAVKTSDLTTVVTEALDKTLVAHREAAYAAGRGSGTTDVAQKRIGAGYIGVECGRALAYKYHKTETSERASVVSPGELQRHAESGHWTETVTAEWLRMAGFDLLTYRKDEEGNPIIGYDGGPQQFGFKAAKDPETGQYRLAGEVDGVIVGVPESLKDMISLDGGVIWESKKATHKKWKKFSSDGVAKADPKYYGQIQTSMAYMGAARCLFSMLNLDNMKYYFEMVEFDAPAAQAITDRAVKVLQSNNPLEIPRDARERTWFMCKFCDYGDQCWDEPTTAQQPETAKPSWLDQKKET